MPQVNPVLERTRGRMGTSDQVSLLLEKIAAHIEVVNRELGEARDEIRSLRAEQAACKNELCQRMTRVEEKLDWLSRFFWLVAGAATTSLAATILQMASGRP